MENPKEKAGFLDPIKPKLGHLEKKIGKIIYKYPRVTTFGLAAPLAIKIVLDTYVK
jgi:hypothetical protein